MMITDVIREAETEHVVYFLLTAYVEAVRFGDQQNLLPEPVKALPLTGRHQVRERFEQLVIELDKASQRLNDNACVVIKEALHIFISALNRLEALPDNKSRSSHERRKCERRQISAGSWGRRYPADVQGEMRHY